ncbi:MAG: hypothetical protein A2385_10085 [Bdellovibrionales bacterium RIFOXYB1_FULL_39_21]|nr:MAG: hypothetical protein A2385_10085 [Bdellovibrionales bacterium RIFOXYB1_FULL_39_21]OFZ74652.1 MAG: hypothetical protein A2560_09655 [Bdellovibrionales bacterium RIFOXYD1_FULL_39_84]
MEVAKSLNLPITASYHLKKTLLLTSANEILLVRVFVVPISISTYFSGNLTAVFKKNANIQ